MIEMRLRSKVSDTELKQKVGKILTDADYNVLVTRQARILKPDGRPLLVYLPGALGTGLLDATYDVLHSLKKEETDNRGLASGTKRIETGGTKRKRSKLVSSAIVGAFDPSPTYTYCRLTAWSGRETEKYRNLWPLFQAIGHLFEEHVPDRYATQMRYIEQTHADWVIPDTPFTTITVNNTYPTGVHTDAGDLDEGFSTLAVLRRGAYEGGRLVFPEYRVAVDMGHGDVLLMDAHEWHGNTALRLLDPPCWYDDNERATVYAYAEQLPTTASAPTGKKRMALCAAHLDGLNKSEAVTVWSTENIIPAERISVVSYYRTKMTNCGSFDEEAAKAVGKAEKRTTVSMVDEMALEAAGVRTEGA